MNRTTKAFTLIELLTVIAITGVLLTLILVPVIQSFNFTRNAEGFAEAQQKGRSVLERISREIGNSTGVRDNYGVRGQIAVELPGLNGAAINPVLLDYAKVDVVKPAEGDPGQPFVNPNTGYIDPTLKAPKGQMVLPIASGNTLVRYWIGKRDPSRPYNNPYDGLLMAKGGLTGRDNLFVLYRAEVQPYIPSNGRFVPNQLFFDVDPGTIVGGDPLTGKAILDDPYFFIPDRDSTGAVLAGAALAAKQTRVQNWLTNATILTEVSRYDMIQAVFDRQKRRVVYDGNVPRVLPLVQFRPTSIGSEPAGAMSAVRQSEETDNSASIAPDVFETKYGNWNSPVIRMWPGGWASGNPYLIGRTASTVNGDRFGVFFFDPLLAQPELSGGVPLFDATLYRLIVDANQPYPFSKSLDTANLANQVARDLFVPYSLNTKTGRFTTSFNIEEVGDTTQTVFRADRNRPLAATGPALTPLNDPALGGTIASAPYAPSIAGYQINKNFNKVWTDNAGMRPDVHRYIDLRVLNAPDGTTSPLNPDPAVGFSRARIVPGSEVIIGPDQRPGPNYGNPIRYFRTTKNPGINEYRINYTHLQEPADYTLLGFANPPAVYTPADLTSAVIQPRYKSGYVQFNSDPNVPLPTGNITVSYRFQFTNAVQVAPAQWVTDTFAVDYETRELIDILLTMRNYTQVNLPNPQTITLKATAKVRNSIR